VSERGRICILSVDDHPLMCEDLAALSMRSSALLVPAGARSRTVNPKCHASVRVLRCMVVPRST
jgi:hypothetical protein